MEINLAKYNRHWEKNFNYPYPKKRKIFSRLLPYLDKKQIIEITGLRRVGKSTVFFQIINFLKEKKVDPYHILYFTFDENQPSIETILNTYAVQVGNDYKKIRLYLFLDEIQKLPNFQNQIKVFYDLYPNIKFIISGSTSLFIRKKTQESLAGRIFSFLLTPLSFDEYLMFKEKEELLNKPKLYQSDLNREFEIFLSSQFIESIPFKTSLEKREYFLSIIKKIVFEDLPVIFKFDNPQLLFRIVQCIGQKPGCIINNLHLAQELEISNKTVSLYLFYLEESLLVKKFYNFSRNLISSEKRFKKYYLASSSFSWALVEFWDSTVLFENYIASLITPCYFYKDTYGHEIDFVLVDDKQEILPLEAKYKTRIDKEDYKNLLLFMKKYSLNNSVLAYKGIDDQKITREGKSVHLIPFYKDFNILG